MIAVNIVRSRILQSFSTHLRKIPPLPSALTSYDVLKAVAIILVVIDHIGLYFYLDELWYRSFGRLCVPIWFFLIGFAQTRKIGKDLVFCAALITASKFVLGLPIFPMNILWNFIFIRLVLDGFIGRFISSEASPLRALWPAYLALFVGVMATLPFVDYGLLGLMFAIAGVECRRLYQCRLETGEKGDIVKVNQERAVLSLMLASISFFIWQSLIFEFSKAQLGVMGGGLVLVFISLCSFKPKLFEGRVLKCPLIIAAFIQVLGRQTLWIYTLHILVFGVLGQFVDPERYQLFQWQWFEEPRDEGS